MWKLSEVQKREKSQQLSWNIKTCKFENGIHCKSPVVSVVLVDFRGNQMHSKLFFSTHDGH